MTDRQGIAERWRRLDVVARDLPLGVALFLMSLLPITHGYGTLLGGLPDRPADLLSTTAVALQSLPLAFRRRWPVLCLGLVSAGFAVDQLAGYHTFAGLGLIVALLSVGSYAERHRKLVALVFSAVYIALVAGLYRMGATEPWSEFVTFYIVLAFATGVGAWQRAGRIAEQDRVNRIAGDTRAMERTRIARDLHDVVTHHVTAMVVQAEAARYYAGAPDRVDDALDTIAGTGRRAIADLRQVLNVLNPDYGANGAPGATDVADLVKHARRAGLRIEFTEHGSAQDPAGGTELVVYRVVQEALTNARKHAPGSHTAVNLRHRTEETTVEIVSDAKAQTVHSVPSSTRLPEGGGHGLAGLHARVMALDGDLSTGPREDGRFIVFARIPTRNRS